MLPPSHSFYRRARVIAAFLRIAILLMRPNFLPEARMVYDKFADNSERQSDKKNDPENMEINFFSGCEIDGQKIFCDAHHDADD